MWGEFGDCSLDLLVGYWVEFADQGFVFIVWVDEVVLQGWLEEGFVQELTFPLVILCVCVGFGRSLWVLKCRDS